MKTLAIIPARKGSKRVKNKNKRLLNGKPLISYSIEHALSCNLISDVYVSTNDEDIIEIASRYGLNTLYKRPEYLCKDNTPDKPVIEHLLEWLQNTNNIIPDNIIYLRPTSPLREPEDITNVIKKLISINSDSVRTVTKVEGVNHPYWMYTKTENDIIKPFVPEIKIEEYYQSQLLPAVYRLNGVVDGINAKSFHNRKSLYGEKIAMVEVPEIRAMDIDTEFDFEFVEFLIKKK